MIVIANRKLRADHEKISPSHLIDIPVYCVQKRSSRFTNTGQWHPGKWSFVSVTTVLRDSLGNILPTGMVYPNPPDAYYQFNNNGSWVSKFVSDGMDDINNQGFYRSVSDTSFVIYNTGQNAYSEDCKIYSLTASQFIFSHRRNTKFNGVTPGSEEYIFKLTR